VCWRPVSGATSILAFRFTVAISPSSVEVQRAEHTSTVDLGPTKDSQTEGKVDTLAGDPIRPATPIIGD